MICLDSNALFSSLVVFIQIPIMVASLHARFVKFCVRKTDAFICINEFNPPNFILSWERLGVFMLPTEKKYSIINFQSYVVCYNL